VQEAVAKAIGLSSLPSVGTAEMPPQPPPMPGYQPEIRHYAGKETAQPLSPVPTRQIGAYSASPFSPLLKTVLCVGAVVMGVFTVKALVALFSSKHDKQP
jgi:hypothetical protein